MLAFYTEEFNSQLRAYLLNLHVEKEKVAQFHYKWDYLDKSNYENWDMLEVNCGSG